VTAECLGEGADGKPAGEIIGIVGDGKSPLAITPAQTVEAMNHAGIIGQIQGGGLSKALPVFPIGAGEDTRCRSLNRRGLAHQAAVIAQIMCDRCPRQGPLCGHAVNDARHGEKLDIGPQLIVADLGPRRRQSARHAREQENNSTGDAGHALHPHPRPPSSGRQICQHRPRRDRDIFSRNPGIRRVQGSSAIVACDGDHSIPLILR
jgi:hypothetical protein